MQQNTFASIPKSILYEGMIYSMNLIYENTNIY